MDNLYAFSAQTLGGETVSLDKYRDKVLLIVNTASECGFTPQYKGLQDLYERYASRGFEVLGFPCNQFGSQEPGNEPEIATFCETHYDVTFPLFAKVDVNGDAAAPVYRFLKREKPGLLGTEAIKWNFTKFLVDRGGNVVARFAPNDTPDSIEPEVARAL
jgi:glutathione peroxidase